MSGSHLAPGNSGNTRKRAERAQGKRERDDEVRSARQSRVAEPETHRAAPADRRMNDALAAVAPKAVKADASVPKRKKHVLGKILLILLALGVAVGAIGIGTAVIITHGPSEQAKTLFVRTFKDTGTVRWVPDLFLSEDEVQRIVNPVKADGTKKYTIEKEAVVTEVTIEPIPEDEPVIELKDIIGASWHGKMVIVRDPGLVRLALPKRMEETGAYGFELLMQIEDFCEQYGAVAGITAGGFSMENGRPLGFVIKNGKVIISNDVIKISAPPAGGFTEDHKLIVGNMSEQEALDRGIVEGFCWQPLLIVDGIKQTGMGGGYNPRAAIGQRADGTVILVLIEGRMVSSLGATYDDLADFMEEQGCINAINLDSGRSSVMVYEGEVVTKIAVGAGIQTVSRAAPNAFVVMPVGWTNE